MGLCSCVSSTSLVAQCTMCNMCLVLWDIWTFIHSRSKGVLAYLNKQVEYPYFLKWILLLAKFPANQYKLTALGFFFLIKKELARS